MTQASDHPPDDSAILNAFLEAAVDAMIISDAGGIILRANPATCDMFGYTADDLLGRSVNLLMTQDMAREHDGFINNHVRTGENRIIGIGRDVKGQRKDKSTFPLHLSVGRAQVAGRALFVAILRDLTLQNQTRDALARSQRLDAVGQMTGGIAHDFNNLLTVIIGNLALLEARGTDDRQRPLIHDALESAELGAELTSRLMAFAGRSDLSPVRSDLRDLCEATLAILRRTIGTSFRIKTEFAADLHNIMIDPVYFQTALMNLVLNARDAMGGLGGELLISTANVAIDDTYIAQETDIAPGHYVRLSVSDNGQGMTQEAQKRAFEPFFTTKSATGGTGLGLAMVYGFVRQSGGHITLYSELGHGTSFGLYFPALDVPDDDAIGTGTQSPPTAPRAHGETVLVVEDNPKVRKLSAIRIADLGFVTLEAANGDEAYALLRSGQHVDLVFTDLVMPGGLNGYDLAAKIAQDFPKIKVLLTSGYASDVVTNAMAHDRTYDILHKPFRQSDLAARLQALLAGNASG